MVWNIQEHIKNGVSFLKQWANLVIYYGLGLFAFGAVIYLVTACVIRKTSFLVLCELILFSFEIFSLSFLAYRKFPGRFIKWKQDNLWPRESAESSLFLPPYSNLLMSVSLSFFILSFFESETRLVWEQYSGFSETIYELIAGLHVVAPIVIIYCVVITFPLLFLKKVFFSKRGIPTIGFYIFVIIITIFLFGENSPVVKVIFDPILKNTFVNSVLNNILILFTKLIKFMIGCVPLGWFYELFVGSIAKDAKEKRRTSGIRL